MFRYRVNFSSNLQKQVKQEDMMYVVIILCNNNNNSIYLKGEKFNT